MGNCFFVRYGNLKVPSGSSSFSDYNTCITYTLHTHVRTHMHTHTRAHTHVHTRMHKHRYYTNKLCPTKAKPLWPCKMQLVLPRKRTSNKHWNPCEPFRYLNVLVLQREFVKCKLHNNPNTTKQDMDSWYLLPPYISGTY